VRRILQPGFGAQVGLFDMHRAPVLADYRLPRATALGDFKPRRLAHVTEETPMPRACGGDGSSAVLASQLGDSAIWPQQQPPDHAAQPDQQDLEPSGEACGIHDQINREEIDRRTRAKDGNVEDGGDDGVAQAADTGAGRPQEADCAENGRRDDRPSEDQEAEQNQDRGREIEHCEHDRGEHRDEARSDPIHTIDAT
jgi:hypothetical protein